MPRRSKAPPAPDPHAVPHVAVVEGAHAELGLGDDDVARAVGANVSTPHRWRAGDAGPAPVFRHRLTALAELTAAVRGLRRRPGAPTAAAGLGAPAVNMPGLGGERPRAVLAAGQLERLAALVTAAATAAVTAAAPLEPVPLAAPELGRAAPKGLGSGPPGRPAGVHA